MQKNTTFQFTFYFAILLQHFKNNNNKWLFEYDYVIGVVGKKAKIHNKISVFLFAFTIFYISFSHLLTCNNCVTITIFFSNFLFHTCMYVVHIKFHTLHNIQQFEQTSQLSSAYSLTSLCRPRPPYCMLHTCPYMWKMNIYTFISTIIHRHAYVHTYY